MEYERKRCGQLWYHLLWKLLALGFLSFPLSQVERAVVTQIWLREWGSTLGADRVTRCKECGLLDGVEWSCPTHQVKEKWTCILFKLLYCWFLRDGSLACTPRKTLVLGPLGFHSLRLSQLSTRLIVGGSGGLDCTKSSFKVHLKN